MQPADLQSMAEGARIAGLLPYLEHEIERLDHAVDLKASTAHGKGELTPQFALNLWIEKLAYRAILTRLAQRVKVGQAAGAKIGPEIAL